MRQNKKGFLTPILLIVIVALVGTGIYFVSTKQIPSTPATSIPPVQSITTLPSPSPVLKPLPTNKPVPKPNPSNPATDSGKIIKKVGEQEGSFLVQKINQDTVDGRWFQAYPIAQLGEGTPKTLRIGDDIGYTCAGVTEKLTSINFSKQEITFTKIVGKTPTGGCPICLSDKTLIDTPRGSINVKDLKVGMSIWTMDSAGLRVFGIIQKTSKVPVPLTHKMVHLVLDDGRELFVSPGHPTVDGRTVGNLVPQNLFDGARVLSALRVSYGGEATYDILPSGETGFYFANGILLDSTLH